jgi:ABC-type polar amino acid transport system ATPase subunit
MSEVLEVSDLEVHRDGRAVVSGISFTAQRGERVALMGPSGAGKTTVLRAIAGLESKVFGALSVSRPQTADLREDPLVLNFPPAIGMVFQFHHLFDHLTALENVLLAPVNGTRAPCSISWVSATGSMHGRTNYPVERPSAWPSPGPW